jgi:hypothetical protein
MKLRLLIGVATMLAAPVLHADVAQQEDAACFDAAVAGQKAQKAGELGNARAAFLQCARAVCPAEVTARCTNWVAEIDAAMPSVLIAAQDDRGHDLLNGVIRIDGVSHPEALEGQSVTLEPGPHALRLETVGRAPVEQSVVVREHEKNRRVVLRIAPLVVVHRTSIVPFVLGGVGVAFALSFASFATAGVVDRQSSACDSAPGCSPTDASRVRAELAIADISLALAGVFVIAAIIDFVATRPSASARTGSLPFIIRF